jgi:hypothetical protein
MWIRPIAKIGDPKDFKAADIPMKAARMYLNRKEATW